MRGGWTKPAILFVSSPMEKKVVYAQVQDFKALHNTVEPLIDSGLETPNGIAYDAEQNVLFVTDYGAKKIFGYNILIQKWANGMYPYQVTVASQRITIVQDVESQWVTTDPLGNLYYTDQRTKSINKVPKLTVHKLMLGELLADDLAQTSDQEGLALAEADASENMQAITGQQHSHQDPGIQELFSESTSSNVGSPPGGLAASLNYLFWTNAGGGEQKGSLVGTPQRSPDPEVLGGSSGATRSLANNTDSAMDAALTYNMVVYSAAQHYVFGMPLSGGTPVMLSEAFSTPRGIVWDGDSTIFVVDQAANTIMSMPCGRLASNLPIEAVLDFHDPFGLAIMRSTDPTFAAVLNGAAGLVPQMLVLLAVGMAYAF